MRGAGASVVVRCVAERPSGVKARGFVEAGGYVAIDAGHYDRAVGQWRRIDGIGRTGAGMTPWPVTSPSRTPGGSSPRLEYEVTLLSAPGEVTVWAYLSPRNPALPGSRACATASPWTTARSRPSTSRRARTTAPLNTVWARNTSDNVNRTATRHTVTSPGVHRLRFWMVDPTVVVQRLLIDTGGVAGAVSGAGGESESGGRSPVERQTLRRDRPVGDRHVLAVDEVLAGGVAGPSGVGWMSVKTAPVPVRGSKTA